MSSCSVDIMCDDTQDLVCLQYYIKKNGKEEFFEGVCDDKKLCGTMADGVKIRCDGAMKSMVGAGIALAALYLTLWKMKFE